MLRHRLCDAVWVSLWVILSDVPEIWKSDEQSVRHFVEAVAWVLRTGTAWADRPPEFGKSDSVQRRFRRWAWPAPGTRAGTQFPGFRGR
jgi:transposase